MSCKREPWICFAPGKGYRRECETPDAARGLTANGARAQASVSKDVYAYNRNGKQPRGDGLTTQREVVRMTAESAQTVVESTYIQKMCAAIESESVEQLESCLRKYGMIHGKCRKGGHTLLTKAVEQQNREMAELLIARGADLEGCDDSGSTPLIIAACKGNPELVQQLWEKGADVHAKNLFGCSALDVAINVGRNALEHQDTEKHSRYHRVRDILEKAGARATPDNRRCACCQ